jgi:hypothetical protein
MRNTRIRTQTAAMAAMLLIAGAGAAYCQQRGGDPAQMVDRQVAAMKERLKLTDEQEKKVKPILLDSIKKNAEMRKKYNFQQGERPSEEAMAEMKKTREETNKKLGDVLSKEQMTEYEKILAERRGGQAGGGGQGRRKKTQ